MTEEPTSSSPAPRPSFAHASEAELARILTYYDVRWEYEPDTFPIGWTLGGDVVESFSPDFYLPDLDLYIELTTLKQSLVRKKNRKLRRLRELYPDVRIKLFYARDFRMLLLKFGRLALADELSGTTGQATPPRANLHGAGPPPPGHHPSPGGAAPAPRADGRGVTPTDAARRRRHTVDPARPAAEAVGAPDVDRADSADAAAGAAAGLRAADAEAASTPRGRRRGRRRRASARAALAAGAAPLPGSPPLRGPGAAAAAETRPA